MSLPTLRRILVVLAALGMVGGSRVASASPRTADPTQGAFLRIVTDPPEALVSINRSPRGSSPLELTDLAPGRHLVWVSAHGHRDWFETVMLEPGSRRSVEVRLEPIRGSVLIRSEPGGMQVSIQGAHRGTTPLLVPHLELGRYRVVLTAPGFQERVLDLDVANATPQQLKVRMLTDSATLRVVSDPPGASVLLRGVPRGSTPVVLERIPDGDSVLEIRAEGYATFRQTLRLSAGEDETLSVPLDPLPARLNVVSIPPGGRMYVDNQYRGETPLELTELPPATYRVRVESPGHDPMARDVVLRRAASVVEEFRLVANSGSLRVISAPAGVSVLVDGRLMGTTEARPEATDQVSDPLSIPGIPAGRRDVLFTRQGFYEARRTVEIERDKAVSLDVTLRRRFIPDYEVRTDANVYRGVLVNITPEFVRLETEVGVIRAFPLQDVRSRRPLREEERIEPEPLREE